MARPVVRDTRRCVLHVLPSWRSLHLLSLATLHMFLHRCPLPREVGFFVDRVCSTLGLDRATLESLPGFFRYEERFRKLQLEQLFSRDEGPFGL